VRLFPTPGTLGTQPGRQAVLDPPFGSSGGTPSSPLVIAGFYSTEVPDDPGPWDVDPENTTLLN
jgi:hypothetical protein